MGVLTDDVTRLRNEVLAFRSARHGLIRDLERETRDRRADVSRMLANFSKGLGAVATRTKADRSASISDLKRRVTDLLTEVRTDLRGIRQGWLSPGTALLRPLEELRSLTSLEGGADAEGARSGAGGCRPPVIAAGEKPTRKKRKH
jgi:hypothetical protein